MELYSCHDTTRTDAARGNCPNSIEYISVLIIYLRLSIHGRSLTRRLKIYLFYRTNGSYWANLLISLRWVSGLWSLNILNSPMKPFTEVTLLMSRSSQPTIPLVLPCYHLLETHLQDAVNSTKIHSSLSTAAQAGLTKLQKYKAYVDDNRFYILGTSTYDTAFSVF